MKKKAYISRQMNHNGNRETSIKMFRMKWGSQIECKAESKAVEGIVEETKDLQ